MNWRSAKLIGHVQRLSLQGELPCTWPLPHDCQGLIEPAHSNQLRDAKGRAIKAHDYRIAFLCHTAHAECDQGVGYNKEQKRDAWDEAHRKSVGLMFELAIVKVA